MAHTPEKPARPAPAAKVNRLGLARESYRGGKTTLCAGCGHNAISERIIDAFYDMGVDPYNVAKFSGIGCSSKSPAYFLNPSHGFNAVHGRMPSVATGAALANHNLMIVGVSGDGDTASIGMGQFVHLTRRNLSMIYIIEDNGVYGLTKGQFSATADKGSRLKTGVVNDLPAIDMCAMAIELGASFVARAFSGDKSQLTTILKAAISHRGMALLDIISPCVTFNDHEGSTKSYDYVKEHEEKLSDLGFVPFFDDISVDYAPGTTQEVTLHDGSRLLLSKLPADYNPSRKMDAQRVLAKAREREEVLTGILYVNPKADDFISLLNLVAEPLAVLPESRVRPSRETLQRIMDDYT